MKNARSTDYCADLTDVTNFAVITNAIIKRFHCIFIVCKRDCYCYALAENDQTSV